MAELFQSPIFFIGLILIIGCIVLGFVLKDPRAKRMLTTATPQRAVVKASPSSSLSSKSLGQSPQAPGRTKTQQHQVSDEIDFFELMNQGNEHLGHSQWDEALGAFQQAVKMRQDEPAVHFKIGRVFVQKEDYKHAVIAFNNVLTLNPEQVEAHFELARIYQSLQQPDESIRQINAALQIDPTHEESLKYKVRLLEQLNRHEDSLPALQQLIHSAGPRQKKYQLHYAETLVFLGQKDNAIERLLELIERDSSNKSLYEVKIANIYYGMEQFEKAIEFYRRIFYADDALGKNPETKSRMAAALCNQGVKLNSELNDKQGAVQYYLEALKYDSENGDIFYNLGKAYLELGQVDNARSNLEQALTISPNDAASAYELAMLEDQQGHMEPAMRYYRIVLAVEPKNALAAYGLGALYGVQGNMELAIDYLSQAVESNPFFEDAIYNLGVALEHKNQPNKALQMYKKVLKINPNHPQAQSNLTHLKHTATR